MEIHPRCCSCGDVRPDEISRRGFIGGLGAATLGGIALTGLTWTALKAAERELPSAPRRRPLVVKPVLTYEIPQRREQSSWRAWGGIQTQRDLDAELARIRGELDKLKAQADFPLDFRPLSAGQGAEGLAAAKEEIAAADACLVYAAGGWGALEMAAKTAKDTIVFCRQKSGPTYLWYEIVSPIFLRQRNDEAVLKNVDDEDVVIDDQNEILWRLRALCGLRNTIGARVLTIGPAGDWSQKYDAPKLARQRFKLDIQTISFEELTKLIQDARADQAAVDRAKAAADAYLKIPGTTLETERKFVDNAFLLKQVFVGLMKKADCRAVTVRRCMGAILSIAETTACLPLSTLNDDGYMAFCESDFVLVPAGMLLRNIADVPQFMNDPTYPHKGVITLAHCTGPRKMDGKTHEPARILTHFESDYGAAPKVEMRKGQVVTNIIPDFKAERYVGLRGEIVDVPFLPICRDQIDVRFQCDSLKLARRMPGFHWVTCYGDYLKEYGYALRRVGIQWENLG
jgi:L-fucose isomerase-like protein